MDPDVLELVLQDRLLEAAHLSSERAQFADASVLFERACDWTAAALQALSAQDYRRALVLGLRAGDSGTAMQAVDHAIRDPPTAETTAAHLTELGHHSWAARILEGIGLDALAATAWERAGDALAASRLLDRSGEAGRAVRVLEAALRRDPTAAPILLALGAVLVRLSRHDGAVRILQRIPTEAPERKEALGLLVPSFRKLGLLEAEAIAASEFAKAGGRSRPPNSPASPGVVSADSATLFGRYEIKAEIGSSHNARVFECVDPIRSERVAVKVFVLSGRGPASEMARTRFEHDVRAIAGIHHRNVVPVREIYAEVPAVVLAFMEGGSLEPMLARGPLAPARAVEIACAVLDAVAEAHLCGMLHADIKPSNVLFDGAGSAHLADFGMAHLADVSATAVAGEFGALAYKSPEERQGLSITTRSDVFAVGVLLRDMLTGRRLPSRAMGAAPSAVHPDLDASHDALVLQLTASDPARRPEGAAAARAEILARRWPRALAADPQLRAPRTDASSAETIFGRLEPVSEGVSVDTWTGRRVSVIPLSDAVLARARAFAIADHPALAAVLRVDRERGAVWIEAPRGEPIARALRREEVEKLADALDALHAAGVAHGAVNAAHIMVDDTRGVVLQFAPLNDATATFDDDRRALSRL